MLCRFVLYQLRTSYLANIKDGVGERLITVNASVLNDPAFRAAGWLPNPPDIKRTYSPPIPTAITAEYFQAPRIARTPGAGFGDENEEEGGMVTGGGASNETVGPDLRTRRRRRKEQMDEDDSSDLSDESDDDVDNRPVNQIKFAKMPVRTRAGSSPLRSGNHLDGPALLVTSPSRPGEDSRLRRGSLGANEVFRGRPRKDTTTSSELSSENELDASYFQRKHVNPRKAAKASALLSERIQEDEREGNDDLASLDGGAESDSSLSSAFEGTADSTSILAGADPLDSLPTKLPGVPLISTPRSSSPRKAKVPPQLPLTMKALPGPRPISMVAPVSALTMALKAKDQAPSSPFDKFATLSAKADPNPLYIKIYVPSSSKPSKPMEVLLKRFTDGGNPTTVAEAIGLALYRYGEDKLEPAIGADKMNVNLWNFRMVEDEEVDFDFPALSRTRPMTEFTSSNNRPARGRARDKPWDEFGLVEANEKEFQENEKSTPQYSKDAAEAAAVKEDATPTAATSTSSLHLPANVPTPSATPTPSLYRNPITGPSFTPAATIRAEPLRPLDAPAAPSSTAATRSGAPKALTVHYTDENFLTRTTKIEVTTDTYIAEVFDAVCKRLGVDKGLHVLKVSGSTVVAPPDRTLEALGDRTDLDLVRRRFVGDGIFGLAGSPGSSSPNAPLFIGPGGTPKKASKKAVTIASGLPGIARLDSLAALSANATYKRYNVLRKQPMSFAREASRVLTLDGDYIHIMPTSAEHHPTTQQKVFDAPGKVTTIHFSSVVGCKVSRRHPKTFRVVVYKERESKRYDFEAVSASEAAEIVAEIKRSVARFQETGL